MNVFLGIIIICLSFLNIFSPEKALRFQDMFRIRGDREYSPLAIGMTRIGGVIGFIFGFVIMFSDAHLF